METKRQLSVSIIGDSPFGVLGLKTMLNSMDISVRTAKDRLMALTECEPGEDDAILIDIYFVNATQVLLEATKRKIQCGGQFIIFSEIGWSSCDGMTFIHRCSQADTIKKQLLQGIIGSCSDAQ
ncbi:CheY-like chemotaxis protein [Serratia sp. BIGb0234]|uniref:hypothetical protein n=1 Tax=Serratia sp. BIGb0234 TaxID=2940614 RepID=UPI0021686C42|nr:hypothetical protein [Serratia sp. BIGb0234]MCS4320878.1 CheY-like chemotaxis protein [Serratia sp. BIGb0234]